MRFDKPYLFFSSHAILTNLYYFNTLSLSETQKKTLTKFLYIYAKFKYKISGKKNKSLLYYIKQKKSFIPGDFFI